MAVALFSKGSVVEIDHREYILHRKIDKGLWQLEDRRTGAFEQRTFPELQSLLTKGQLVFVQDIPYGLDARASEIRRKRTEAFMSRMDEAELADIRRKHAYVQSVMELPSTEAVIKAAVEQTWRQLGCKGAIPNWTSVLRWKRRYQQFGSDALMLRELSCHKGNRSRRYPDRVIQIVRESIDKVYLTRERKTVQDVVDCAIVQVIRENDMLPGSMQLPLPSRRLVQGMIDSMDAFDKHAARFGQLAAVRKFRSVQHVYVSSRPLECVEIDHTRTDILVVDDKSGLPMGRPWITACIDRYSRCILGIYITFAPPSNLSVARCLKHAILPKVDLREQYPEIENEWYAHGVMTSLVVDNGLEFHGDGLEMICLALGINIHYTPRKTPWMKGQIERYLGTLNRGVAHGHPGTTFSGILDKEDYDPAQHAAVSYDTFKRIVHKWIADVYHQRPHRSLDGRSPAAVWEEGIRPEDIPLPSDLNRFDAILGKPTPRRLTHKGIELHGLSYNSSELMDYRRQHGDRLDVDVRIDEGDLEYIHVIAHDNSEIFRVRCVQHAYAAGISKWQHDLMRQYVRRSPGLVDNPEGWRKAKADIAEIVEADVLRKQKKRGKKLGDKASRYLEENRTARSASTPAVPATTPQDKFAETAAIPVSTTQRPRKKLMPELVQRSSD